MHFELRRQLADRLFLFLCGEGDSRLERHRVGDAILAHRNSENGELMLQIIAYSPVQFYRATADFLNLPIFDGRLADALVSDNVV